MFANNERDGTKGSVVGDSKENTFWFVQCGSVMGRKCLCPRIVTHCNLVPRSHSVLHVAVGDLGTRLNPLYFPLKEIAIITTFVKIVNKFTGVECE